MPNTLAHLGVQAVATRSLIPRAEPGWIWLGCILPDLPWILQRVVAALPLDVPEIALRLYAVAQSSLAVSLLAAGGVAFLSPVPTRVFAIVSTGCLLHLLIDALQTKWANGVVLFAPIDWSLVNFGLFWPEDWQSYALSAFGMLTIAYLALRNGPAAVRWSRPAAARLTQAAVLLFAYVLLPFVLGPMASAADPHFAATLREVSQRPGREIEFDRASLQGANDGTPVVAIWTGETLGLASAPDLPEEAEISIKGHFKDAETVNVTNVHLHPVGRRDLLTQLGLGLILCWWLWAAALAWLARGR